MFKFETKRLIIRDMSLKDKSAFVAMSRMLNINVFMMKVIVTLVNTEN